MSLPGWLLDETLESVSVVGIGVTLQQQQQHVPSQHTLLELATTYIPIPARHNGAPILTYVCMHVCCVSCHSVVRSSTLLAAKSIIIIY